MNRPAEDAAESGIIYGKNAVTELLKSGTAADTVWVSAEESDKAAAYYSALAKACGAVVKRVPAQKLARICGSDRHQGVACSASFCEYKSVEDILALARERGEAMLKAAQCFDKLGQSARAETLRVQAKGM